MVSRLLFTAALGSLGVCSFGQLRSHPYDLIHVDWKVSLDDRAGSVVGDVTNRIKAERGVTEVWFDCGRLTIWGASIDGKQIKHRISDEKVYVTIPENMRDGRTLDIRIKYSGKPQAGLYFIPASRAFPAKTPSIYTQGEMEDTRYWLVTYDYPDDKATSAGTIEVPNGYFALSNGKHLSSRSQGNKTVHRWQIDQPHSTYLISIVAGPYEKGHEQWEDIPVDFYVPAGLMDMGLSSFGGTAPMVQFFSELTGFRYPYAKFAQSAVPDYMFGGMENISAVTNTIGTLHPASAKPITSSEGLVLHELAHQWFGDVVTCSGWSDAWINEGWASFLPSFYVRKVHGEDPYHLSRYDTFNGGLGAHRAEPGRAVVFTGYDEPLEMFDGYIYAGGASRMFMLMNLLGEQEFWRATKMYLDQRKWTSFDTQAFFETWSKNTGKDLSGFMQQWFFTPAAPNLTVHWRGEELVLTQEEPYFDLTVPVMVSNGTGWTRETFQVSGRETALRLPGRSGMPVIVDPEVWLMANINYEVKMTPAQKIAAYQAAPNAAGKARVMDLLLRDLTPAESLAFAKTIQSPLLLSRYVGSIRPVEGAEAFLLGLVDHADRNVAVAAVGQLQGFPASAAIDSKLAAISTGDPNPLMKQAASRVLLERTGDQALANRLWSSDSYNDGYRTIAMNWWASRHPEIAREKGLEVLANPPSEPVRVNAIGHLGRLKDKPGERRVYNALVKVVTGETSFGARNTAMNALADYGDKAALQVLRPFTGHSLVFFRQTAKGAVARLGG